MGRLKVGGDVTKGSHQIRVAPDLGEMIAWIIRLGGGSTVQLTDPMLRPGVTALYEQYKPAVEKIKAAEAEVERLEAEVKNLSGPDAEPASDPPPSSGERPKTGRRRKAE